MCKLWCNIFLLDWHRTLYLWLLNTSLLQLYFLDPWHSQVFLNNRISPFCPSSYFSIWAFSWKLIISFFLGFGMVLETCCLWQCQMFWKTILFFNGFLNFYIIENLYCCIFAQILYSGKILVGRYRPKCPQPIRLQDFWINHYSRTNGWNSLIFCILIQIHKIVYRNFFGWGWSKMRVANLVSGV